MESETQKVYVITYRNRGRPRKFQMTGLKTDVVEAKNFLKYQGAKSVRSRVL